MRLDPPIQPHIFSFPRHSAKCNVWPMLNGRWPSITPFWVGRIVKARQTRDKRIARRVARKNPDNGYSGNRPRRWCRPLGDKMIKNPDYRFLARNFATPTLINEVLADEAFGKKVEDYLMQNPDVLARALENLQIITQPRKPSGNASLFWTTPMNCITAGATSHWGRKMPRSPLSNFSIIIAAIASRFSRH